MISLSISLVAPLLALPQGTWQEEADALLTAGAIDDAIVVVEEHLDTHADDAAAWRTLGRTLELLWREGGANFLVMDDAAAAWNRAVECAPFDVATLHGAAQLHMQVADYERAAALGMRALGSCRLTDTPVPAGLTELVSRCRIGAFQNAQHVDYVTWEEDLAATWRIVLGGRKAEPDDAAPALVEAGFLDSLGLPDLASEALLQALREHDDDAELHRMLIDLHTREGLTERLPALYSGLGTDGMSGTLAWYTGYVMRLVGDQAAKERHFAQALRDYGTSVEWMNTARVLAPGFASGADQVRVQAQVASAWCLLSIEELDRAEEVLLRVFAEDPEYVDTVDGLGRTAINGMSSLGQVFSERNQFGRAANLSRAVVAVKPEDARWWNNLGFLLREEGSQVEAGKFPDLQDPKAAAQTIYRESWEAYERSIELAPQDARIVNDAALMQVYHVRDQLELAEELLHRSIRIGEAQLAEMPDDVSDWDRFPVAQAVGDAYQNLGYLYYHLYDKPAEARPLWVASMATDSGDRSEFQQYLDAIDGKREPVEEQDGFLLQPPTDEPPPRAAFDWEASFEEATRAARAEGRPLVIYDRGLALGLAIPFTDRMAASAKFESRVEGALLVVSDLLRHNFVDRTRRGQRLLCPQWGTITCAEHVESARQFHAWYEAAQGEKPGESEEGFWIQPAGSSTPRKLEFGSELREDDESRLVEVPLDARTFDPEALSLQDLVATPRRAARDRVERLFFGESGQRRATIVGALRQADSAYSRELLDVGMGQVNDTGLARVLLGAWQDGDTRLIERQASWSIDPDVRAAAAGLLARRPDDGDAYVRRMRARAVVGRGVR